MEVNFEKIYYQGILMINYFKDIKMSYIVTMYYIKLWTNTITNKIENNCV